MQSIWRNCLNTILKVLSVSVVYPRDHTADWEMQLHVMVQHQRGWEPHATSLGKDHNQLGECFYWTCITFTPSWRWMKTSKLGSICRYPCKCGSKLSLKGQSIFSSTKSSRGRDGFLGTLPHLFNFLGKLEKIQRERQGSLLFHRHFNSYLTLGC